MPAPSTPVLPIPHQPNPVSAPPAKVGGAYRYPLLTEGVIPSLGGLLPRFKTEQQGTPRDPANSSSKQIPGYAESGMYAARDNVGQSSRESWGRAGQRAGVKGMQHGPYREVTGKAGEQRLHGRQQAGISKLQNFPRLHRGPGRPMGGTWDISPKGFAMLHKGVRVAGKRGSKKNKGGTLYKIVFEEPARGVEVLGDQESIVVEPEGSGEAREGRVPPPWEPRVSETDADVTILTGPPRKSGYSGAGEQSMAGRGAQIEAVAGSHMHDMPHRQAWQLAQPPVSRVTSAVDPPTPYLDPQGTLGQAPYPSFGATTEQPLSSRQQLQPGIPQADRSPSTGVYDTSGARQTSRTQYAHVGAPHVSSVPAVSQHLGSYAATESHRATPYTSHPWERIPPQHHLPGPAPAARQIPARPQPLPGPQAGTRPQQPPPGVQTPLSQAPLAVQTPRGVQGVQLQPGVEVVGLLNVGVLGDPARGAAGQMQIGVAERRATGEADAAESALTGGMGIQRGSSGLEIEMTPQGFVSQVDAGAGQPSATVSVAREGQQSPSTPQQHMEILLPVQQPDLEAAGVQGGGRQQQVLRIRVVDQRIAAEVLRLLCDFEGGNVM